MSKQEAFNEMCYLKDQIEECADQIRMIMRESFPDQYASGDAYQVFSCVSNSNPYDISIESLLESISEENEEVY
jgi:hypothetical protein